MSTFDLRVMTANLGAGIAPDEDVRQAIKHERPDIVAMQELTAKQGERLRKELAESYPYVVLHGDSHEGRGVFSRFPIAHHHVVQFAEDRPDIRVVVDVCGIALTVIVGHPRPQRITPKGLAFRRASLRQMLRLGRAAIDQGNTILLGDLNMTPRHPGYQRISQLGIIDAFSEAGSGPGYTFPAIIRTGKTYLRIRPVVRFDYIWVTPDIGIQASYVGNATGSDHLPVVADITITR